MASQSPEVAPSGVTRSLLVGKVFATPSATYVDRLTANKSYLTVSTLAAEVDRANGSSTAIGPDSLARISGTRVVSGRAVTVWNPIGHNTMTGHGLERCEAGDVLVIVSPASGAAQFGEIAAMHARARGVAGVIVDGSVRDIAGIRATGMSVWATSVDPRQASKELPGYVNGPISLCGIEVHPGDLVVADDDGVIVVEARHAPATLAAAKERSDREQRLMRDAEDGGPYPAVDEGLSIVHVDRTWDEWMP